MYDEHADSNTSILPLRPRIKVTSTARWVERTVIGCNGPAWLQGNSHRIQPSNAIGRPWDSRFEDDILIAKYDDGKALEVLAISTSMCMKCGV